MKTQKLILGLIVFFFVSCGFVYAQPFETNEIGTGGDPHWSPDGTKLAYVYKGTLFVSNADSKGEKKTIGQLPWGALHFAWLDSNQFIFWGGYSFTEKDMVSRKNVIQTMTLDGKEKLIAESVSRGEKATSFDITAPLFFPDGMVGYYEVPYMKWLWETENAVFKVIKWGKLPPDSALKQMRVIEYDLSKEEHIDRSIWLESADRSVKKKVAQCDHCSFPKLSPDGTKILVCCGGKCPVCILDLKGNEICVGKESINPANPQDTAFIRGCIDGMPTWSPDGKKIAYGYVRYKSVSEHNVVDLGSEIYLENPDRTGRVQVTQQLDKSLGSPVWSPDGTKIACVELHTSKLYVIKLK